MIHRERVPVEEVARDEVLARCRVDTAVSAGCSGTRAHVAGEVNAATRTVTSRSSLIRPCLYCGFSGVPVSLTGLPYSAGLGFQSVIP